MFSFLRGRLRTPVPSLVECRGREFSFLRGRLRTSKPVEVSTSSLAGFHSFEVGFGQSARQPYGGSKCCFHSFEVGFGPTLSYSSRRKNTCFHSFEVGFGQEAILQLLKFGKLFSFLRGRLRTKLSFRVPVGCALFSFLRGRLRTIYVEGSAGSSSSFHSFEVGFGLEVIWFRTNRRSRFHSFEVGFGLLVCFNV